MAIDQDRDLLFGILAVRLKGLSAAQIAGASVAWVSEPGRSLRQCLIEQGVLAERDQAALDRFVGEAVEAWGGDAGEALTAFGGREQARSLFHEAISPSQLDELGTVRLSEAESPPDFGEEISAVDETPGRYTYVSEYARGGMGRVLLVHDEHFGRGVALKELLPAVDPEGKTGTDTPVRQTASVAARFLQEARVTGQLEHPSIVPVYELGRRQDGRLYYTMKLVKGKTLSQVLRGCRTLAERLELLPHFVNLCQAIAYAHSRGVIHRDIKPANVMAGEFGETVVLDWGLAKAEGMKDVHADEIARTQRSLSAVEADAIPKTAYGRALGTPNYMPPEQAEGRIEDIDERSDVYSLGAVLYEMLTGHTPYSGESVPEILDKVISEPLVPVLSRVPDAPPELARICEKALQKEPDARYPSARDLAEEVRRFQSGALVRAYEYSLRELARRFYGRHRAAVNTALAGLVTLLAVGVYSYVSIARARNHEHEQRVVAEQARRAAVEAQDLEREARAVAEREVYFSQIRLVQAYMNDGNYALANETLWKTDESRRGWEWGYLLNRCNADLLTVTSRDGPLRYAKFSPNGARIATMPFTGPIRLWNAEDGGLIATMMGPDGHFRSLAFSPDGQRLVAATQDRTVTMWDAETGKERVTLLGHSGVVNSAEFSPDGTLVLSTSDDGTARLWDADSGGELARLEGHADEVQYGCFSPDGSRLVTCDAGGNARVWDTAARVERCQVTGRQAHFNHDGSQIVTVDGTAAIVWDVRSGARVATAEGHRGFVTEARFTPDGTRIATASLDGTVKLWRADTGAEIATCAHGEPVDGVRCTHDGALLLSFSTQGSVRVWDVETGTEINSISGHSGTPYSAEFSPDGARIVTASADGAFKLWDSRRSLGQFTVGRHAHSVSDAAFSRDGTRVGTVSWDGTARVLDARSGAEQVMIASCARLGGASVAFSPDGTRLVVALDHFTPIVWDLGSRTPIAAFTGHVGKVNSVAFSPDGTTVVSGSWDNTARAWDAQTGEERNALSGHTDTVFSAVYNPEGTRLATASADGTAKVWDASSGRELLTLKGHSGAVRRIAFSPDGSRVVTASADGSARVWDAASGSPLLTLVGHAGGLTGAEFDPDSTRIVTSSMDWTAKLWEADTGDELATLSGHTFLVHAARFSPNGDRIVTASYDNTVRFWDAAPWRRVDLPLAESHAWEEGYAAYKKARVASAPSSPSSAGLCPFVVVTTEEVLRTRLERFRDVLQSETQSAGEGSEEASAGISLSPRPRSDALARLCLRSGDRIVRINERGVTDRETTVRAVEEALRASRDPGGTPLTVEIVRNRRPLLVEFRIWPVKQVRKDLSFPRNQALFMLRLEHDMLVREQGTILQVCRVNAGAMGEPSDDPNALPGLWALGTDDPVKKNLYLTVGVAPHDRLMRFNGEAVTGIDGLRAQYEVLIRRLEAGESVTLVQELERGEFQRVELVATIE